MRDERLQKIKSILKYMNCGKSVLYREILSGTNISKNSLSAVLRNMEALSLIEVSRKNELNNHGQVFKYKLTNIGHKHTFCDITINFSNLYVEDSLPVNLLTKHFLRLTIDRSLSK